MPRDDGWYLGRGMGAMTNVRMDWNMNLNTLLSIGSFVAMMIVYTNGQATTNAKLEIYQQEAVRRIEALEVRQEVQLKEGQATRIDMNRMQQDFIYMKEALTDIRNISREQTLLIQRLLQGGKP